MASSKEYLDFVLEQLAELEDIRARAMMGEYLLYCGGKLFGGVYDDRLLLKPSPSALRLMAQAGLETQMERPYEGAKEMLLVDNVENREFLRELIVSMYDDLPSPKPRKKPVS